MHRILLFIIFLVTAVTCDAQVVDFSESELPIFVISTNDQTIVDEPKITAHLGVVNNLTGVNKPQDDYNEYDGLIGIEIRGNGTQVDPKQSYLIETRKEDGSNNNVSLLGFPKENDWILYSPYYDKSLLRNKLTYYIGNEMGQYASRSQHIELVIDGEYRGVYVLLEKIKRDDNRVDVTPYVTPEQDPAELGYIIKIDANWHLDNGWLGLTYSAGGEERNTLFQYVYPKAAEITEEQKTYIHGKVDEFELAIRKTSLISIDDKLGELIDINSLVDYLIINELTKNPDGYRLSTFMYKDADSVDPLFRMGPIWDYNFGYGNYWGYQNEYEGWEYDNQWWEFPSYIPYWWLDLMQNKEFISILKQRWEMWRKTLINCPELNKKLDAWVEELGNSPGRNFTKWDVLDVDLEPGWHVGSTYEGEIEYLQTWLCNRIDWLDDQIDDLENFYSKINLLVYPNPSDGIINISYVSNLDQSVIINIYDNLGSLVYSQGSELLSGQNEMQVNLNKNKSGVYIVTLSNEKIRHSSKVILH